MKRGFEVLLRGITEQQCLDAVSRHLPEGGFTTLVRTDDAGDWFRVTVVEDAIPTRLIARACGECR